MRAFATRKPQELSGGQQQRVAIARAVACNPDILLLDEPLGALDLKLRRQMQIELKNLHRELGKTFVYVTHDQEEALTMSDRIAVMNAGVLEQISDSDALYYRPNTQFVADFIGEANLLAATVRDAQSATVSGQALAVDVAGRANGQAISIFIRPEHVRLVPPGEGRLNGTLKEVIFTGANRKYVVELPDQQKINAMETTLDAPTWQTGQSVGLAWKPERMLTFV
jgi:spermidine/putrescine transport system ATP-binding protein